MTGRSLAGKSHRIARGATRCYSRRRGLSGDHAARPAVKAGPHEVRRNGEQETYDEYAERARRLEILQRAESEFDPVPFDTEAARIYGRVTAAVISARRKPRSRAVDLMVAATAIAERLPLYTTSPADFRGLDTLLTVVPVTRPPVPHEQRIANPRR